MYFINCFFIYSFFGYLFEIILTKLKGTKFSSGILFLPWTPIYGVGAVLILFLSNCIFNFLNIEKWKEVIIALLLIIIVLTFIEWLGGILIEKLFHVVFWNYHDYQYNIGKYISLEVSLVWGIMSFLLIFFIHPFISRFIDLIPSFITYFLIVIFIIDLFITFTKYRNSV